MQDGEGVVVDVGAAVETEQPEAPGAGSGGVGRVEATGEGGEGIGGDGAAAEIEGEQAVEGAETGDVVVAEMGAVWEGEEGDEGEVGRVWYFLEEGEGGMREGEDELVETGWERVDELGEGCPETRVAGVGERVEEGGGRVDAAVVGVVELVGEAGEDGYAEGDEHGVGPSSHAHLKPTSSLALT